MRKTGELHAKENQGGDKCERGTHQILTRCDFDFTIWWGGGTFKAALIVN